MNRYGEIGRFDCGSFLYLMRAEKHLSRFGDAIWLDFFISRRTAKKRGIKDKYRSRYELGTDGGVRAIRYFVSILKTYLNTYKPEWLAISPAEDNEHKRTNFYQEVLNRIGYYYVARDVDENGNTMYWVDLYKRS